jgi:hypothetical protein
MCMIVHDYSKGKYGSLGAFAQWGFGRNDIFDSAYLYLEPHLDFNMQGEIAKGESFDTQKYYNNCISLAVYFKYFFHQGNMKRDLFLFAGSRLEYLVFNSKKTSPSYEAAYSIYNQDSKINKAHYGVTLGTGLHISQQWEAFIRYDRGFAKVYPDNPNNTYNRLLAIGLNYYIANNW